MKFFFLMVMLVYGVVNSNSHGEQITEIYRGSLIKRELIEVNSNPFITVSFLGTLDGQLAFIFKEFDRLVFHEKPIYEKLKVVREKGDFNDTGLRRLVPGEYIVGDLEQREEIKEVGPISLKQFQYFDVTSRTNTDGILLDDQQMILAQFENLRERSVAIKFESEEQEILELELTRNELNEKLGIHYGTAQRSHPDNLKFEANWKNGYYAPGDVANLYLTAKNGGIQGDVYRILARSISRWHWLDGKMFYVGDLKPGEEKQLMRIFRIPEDIEEGRYWLRIGFNDHSGGKPQLSLTIEIQDE